MTERFFFPRNQNISICFVAYDSADHVTPKTGLTGFTVKYTFGGGGALISWAGAAVTAIGEGIYYLTGTIPDNSGDPSFMVKVSATGMDPWFIGGWISNFNVSVQTNFGMTALPSVAPATLGGLLTSGTTQHTIITNSLGYVGVYTNQDKTQYSLSAAGVLAITDSIWNAAVSTYITAGTMGKKLVDLIIDQWSTALPGGYGAGSAGNILGINLNATITSRSDLNETDVANSVLAALDNANIEPGSVPTSTSGLRQMIQFIFAYFRNKRSASSSVETLYKEDGTTPHGTASITEAAGTVTKGEMS